MFLAILQKKIFLATVLLEYLQNFLKTICPYFFLLELLLAITRNISRSEMRLSRCDSACATQLYVDKNGY